MDYKKVIFMILGCASAAVVNAQALDIQAMLSSIAIAHIQVPDLPDNPSANITRDVQTVFVGTLEITVSMLPDPVCGGGNFTVTATVHNTGAVTPFTVVSFAGLIPNNANVSFVSSAFSPGTPGTFSPLGAGTCFPSGVGIWTIGSTVPAGATWTLTIVCSTTAVGVSTPLTSASAFTTSTPSTTCVTNHITLAPGPTANNFTGSVCSTGVFVGSLSATGGTPPYAFAITTPPPPSQGTLIITDPTTGAIQFTPATGFTGIATFQFDVTDNTGCASNIATGNITVLAGPTALPFSAVTCTDAVVTGSLAPLVSGGTPPYTYSLFSAPVGGSVTIDPVTGAYAFTPLPVFNGVGSFAYQVTDASGCQAHNTVTLVFQIITINPFVNNYQIIYSGSPCSTS